MPVARLPHIGALFVVANPGPTHALLQGQRGEFIKADGDYWHIKIGNMLHRFPAHDPDKGAANAILPYTAVREGDWVEIDQSRLLTKHKNLKGQRLLVEDVDTETCVVLIEGNLKEPIELGLTEVKVIATTDPAPINKKRYQKRIELENRARIGWRETCIALSELLETELWKDATDSDGYTYSTFSDYCQVVLGLGKSQGYDRALAGAVLQSLSGTPENHIPQSVTALVELNKAPAEQRPAILADIANAGETPTRQAIRQQIAPKPATPPVPKPAPTVEPEPDSEAPDSASALETRVRGWLQQAIALVGVERVLDILETLAPECFE